MNFKKWSIGVNRKFLHEQKLIFSCPPAQGPEAQRAGIYINNPDTVARLKNLLTCSFLPGLDRWSKGKILRTLPGITRASRITDKGKVSDGFQKGKWNGIFPWDAKLQALLWWWLPTGHHLKSFFLVKPEKQSLSQSEPSWSSASCSLQFTNHFLIYSLIVFWLYQRMFLTDTP